MQPATLHWTLAAPGSLPDADTTVLLWVAYPDGSADWCSGWLDEDGWRDAATGGAVAGSVVTWAHVQGPGDARPLATEAG